MDPYVQREEFILNKYETIIIIDPNSEKEVVDKIVSDVIGIISDDGVGTITKNENWGKKKLAYEIKGNKEGIYVLIDYETASQKIQRLERYCSLSEIVLKCMTVRAEELPEPRQREITKPTFADDDEDDDFDIRDFDDDDEDDDD
ncbi:TPA: 30S ribosomal protein S6 [bacterium]|nr:30S ribosomal protein S6 [bacterium]